MKYLNLDRTKVASIVDELNILLADYHIYYQKLRNFHWNIVGQSFFDLHLKFEEMYNDSLLKIDEIAERILTLRAQPVSNYSEYLQLSSLEEASTNLTDKEMVETLLEDHAMLLQQLKAVKGTAEAAADEGTMDIVGGYIRDLEKVSWMLDAYISRIDAPMPKSSTAAKKKKVSKKK